MFLLFFLPATHKVPPNLWVTSLLTPHSLLLPWRSTWLRFIKTPSIGTSPSNLLKDKFNFIIYSSFSKLTGIGPVRLFDDSLPFISPNDINLQNRNNQNNTRILAITPYFIEKIMKCTLFFEVFGLQNSKK